MIYQIIDEKFSGMLLRQYLYEQLHFSHNLVKKAKSEEGNILINDEKKTVRYVLRAGDQLKISFPPEEIKFSTDLLLLIHNELFSFHHLLKYYLLQTLKSE